MASVNLAESRLFIVTNTLLSGHYTRSAVVFSPSLQRFRRNSGLRLVPSSLFAISDNVTCRPSPRAGSTTRARLTPVTRLDASHLHGVALWPAASLGVLHEEFRCSPGSGE
ncbi:MAG: hypothetical protein MI923_25895 [Phycisphaerales bacterium]|nr:hypothetical protein [Phycisphaerales bacterium]